MDVNNLSQIVGELVMSWPDHMSRPSSMRLQNKVRCKYMLLRTVLVPHLNKIGQRMSGKKVGDTFE